MPNIFELRPGRPAVAWGGGLFHDRRSAAVFILAVRRSSTIARALRSAASRGTVQRIAKGLATSISGLITIGAECASGDQGHHRHHLR